MNNFTTAEQNTVWKDLWNELMDDAKPFVPLAYYDRAADCIRILFRDCSMVEKWEPGLDVAFLFANHDIGQPLVGMIIAGVKDLDLPKEKVFVTVILEKVKHFHEPYFWKLTAIRQGAWLMGMVCDLEDKEASLPMTLPVESVEEKNNEKT